MSAANQKARLAAIEDKLPATELIIPTIEYKLEGGEENAQLVGHIQEIVNHMVKGTFHATTMKPTRTEKHTVMCPWHPDYGMPSTELRKQEDGSFLLVVGMVPYDPRNLANDTDEEQQDISGEEE